MASPVNKHLPTPVPSTEDPQLPASSPSTTATPVDPGRCRQCKKRRVKCSRTLPRCEACIERGVRCEYVGIKTAPSAQRSADNDAVPALVASTPIAVAATSLQQPVPVARPAQQRQPRQRDPPALPSPPHRARTAPVVVPHTSPAHLPSFPVPSIDASPRSKSHRAAHEGLTKTLTYGADAPLEKVNFAGVDCSSLLLELQACDQAYALTSPASPLLFSASPAPSPPIPFPVAQQAHALLSMYFARIEPSIELFAPAATQAAWQAQCVEWWTVGTVPEGKGWMAAYVAGMALGAMAMTVEEWYESGMVVARETKAKEWVEEAARLLVEDGFLRVPTLTGLRAALLIVYYHFLGFGPSPDVPALFASVRVVLQAAYELDLHVEPSRTEQDKEERRTLWRRVFELETSWAPLVGSKTPLDLSTFSTSLAEPSSAPPSSRDQGRTIAPTSSLHNVLAHTARLSRLLALPRPPSSLDLFLLASELAALAPSVDGANGANEGQGRDPLARMLLHVTGLRVHAALVEAEAPLGEEEERMWLVHAETLLASSPLDCAQAFHLLAVTLLLHGAVLVALRLRITPSTVPPATHASLSTRLLALLHSLQTSPWPVVVHLTVQRGIIVLQRLVQVPAQASFTAAGWI